MGDYDDLQQFMEVVTAYKCKFCEFTATSTQDMGQHVRNDHVAVVKRKKENSAVGLQLGTADVLNAAIQSTSLTDDLTTVSGSPVVVTSKNGISVAGTTVVDSTLAGTTVIGTPVDDTSGTGTAVFVSPSSMSAHDSHLSSLNDCVSVQRVNTSPVSGTVMIALSNGQTLVNQNSHSAAVKTDNQSKQAERLVPQLSEGEYILQHTDSVQLGTDGGMHVLVQDGGVEQVATVDDSMVEPGRTIGVNRLEVNGHTATDSHINTTDRSTVESSYEELHLPETPPEEAEVITKDVYLCGNCSEGFASIQECKDHMTNVHEVTDFQTSCRVDASTQMEPRKRPGRRKKTDKQDQQRQEEQAEMDVSESDEEWTEELVTGPTRSRRKRKPPAALRSDYFLGRIKRKEQTAPREPRPVLGMRCSFPGCTVRFQDEETVREHSAYHIEGQPASDFKCSQCEKILFNWKQTRRHLWKIHRIGVDLLTCQLCNNFKTDVPSKLKIHMEVHGDAKPYHCQECGKSFKQFAQLKNHEICHLPDEIVKSAEVSDKWYSPKQCDICGRTFVNTKCMRTHREDVHGTNKPYKCTICSYAAARKAMLVLHLRTHSGYKPFKCDMCNYCCGDHNSLRRHKMRHSGIKPYSCPHCPYTSIQAISLKVHVKNKHPGMGGVYSCPMCMYGTVNKTYYDNHLMDHKNGLIKSNVVARETPVVAKTTKPGLNKELLQVSKQESALVGSEVPTYFLPSAGNSNIFITTPVSVAPAGSVHSLMEAANLENHLQQSVLVIDGRPVRFQLQTNENGDSVLVEEVSSVNTQENLAQDETAAQLIYSALNAITETADTGSENIDSQNLVAGVESGEIQTSIETHLKEGITTHTITFHLPEGEELTREVTLVSENDIKGDRNDSIDISNDVPEWPENV